VTSSHFCYPAVIALLLAANTTSLGSANDQNPLAHDPNAAKAGEYEFRINCALCHGLGAHGGGRGPDLTRAPKKHAHSDAEMFQIISNGIPGTAMPANGTNGQGVGMTDEEIWQIVTYIRRQEVKAAAQSLGDAARGKELFYGDANCSMCHMVEGKGGRLGPELTAVGGSRTRDAIIDSVRNPSRRLAPGLTEATKEFPQEYESVTVVTAEGKQIKGVTLNEDSFSVQIMDAGEHIYLLDKSTLRSFQRAANPPCRNTARTRSAIKNWKTSWLIWSAWGQNESQEEPFRVVRRCWRCREDTLISLPRRSPARRPVAAGAGISRGA